MLVHTAWKIYNCAYNSLSNFAHDSRTLNTEEKNHNFKSVKPSDTLSSAREILVRMQTSGERGKICIA